MKDELLSSKELWTCYHCGLCSDSCPTEADPGEFMATARRYAIASYDRTGLARVLYTRPVAGTAIAVGVAAFFAAFMYRAHGPQDGQTLALFEFIPDQLIHWTGIAVMTLMVLAGVVGVAEHGPGVTRREGVTLKTLVGRRRRLSRSFAAAWSSRRGRVARPAALPRGLQGRRPGRAVVPPPLVHPRADDLGLPRTARRDPHRLGSGAHRHQGRRARRSRSGTRRGCSARSPGSRWSTASACSCSTAPRGYNRAATKSQASDWLLLVLLLDHRAHRLPHRGRALPARGHRPGATGSSSSTSRWRWSSCSSCRSPSSPTRSTDRWRCSSTPSREAGATSSSSASAHHGRPR